MPTLRRLAALWIIPALAGCTQSVGLHKRLGADDAVVIVAVESAIPLTEARDCDTSCSRWYPLEARNSVYAFPARIGTTFQLTQVLAADSRVFLLDRAAELPIEQPGVYFYGTIFSSRSQLLLVSRPIAAVLREAWQRFGAVLRALHPVNFSWPAAAPAPAFRYDLSVVTQQRLAALPPSQAALVELERPPRPELTCGPGVELRPPDRLDHVEYLRRAVNAELAEAGWYDEAPAARVRGRVTRLKFRPEGSWEIGWVLESGHGDWVEMAVRHTFTGWLDAEAACAAGERAFREAVSGLIEATVGAPNFARLARLRRAATATATTVPAPAAPSASPDG